MAGKNKLHRWNEEADKIYNKNTKYVPLHLFGDLSGFKVLKSDRQSCSPIVLLMDVKNNMTI